jgi:hypothetical protein
VRRQVATHGSNRLAVLGSVKGDIILLQRHIDGLAARYDDDAMSGLPDVEALLLQHFPAPSTADDSTAADMHAKLLELYVQRVNAGCAAAIRRLQRHAGPHVSLVSRTEGIVGLMNAVHHLTAAPPLADGRRSDSKMEGTQTADIRMDRELAELHQIVRDQRDLHSQFKRTLTNPVPMPPPAAPPAAAAPAARDVPVAPAREERVSRAAREQLEDARRHASQLSAEITGLKRRIAELERETREMAAQRQDDVEAKRLALAVEEKAASDRAVEREREVSAAAGGMIAFNHVDRGLLSAVGVPDEVLRMCLPCALPDKPAVEVAATKIQSALQELVAEPVPQTTRGKAKRSTSSLAIAQEAAAAEATLMSRFGSTWAVLQSQSTLVTALQDALRQQQAAVSAASGTVSEARAHAERASLVLTEKLAHVTSERDQLRQALSNATAAHATAFAADGAPTASAPQTNGALRTQAEVTVSELRRTHEKQYSRLQRRASELESEASGHRQRVELAEQHVAATMREANALRSKLDAQVKMVADLSAVSAQAQSEVTTLRAQLSQLRKEARDHQAVETESQQKLWRVGVELRIAQNVIDELRRREEEASSKREEAAACHDSIAFKLSEERNSHAREIARLNRDVINAKHEARVAQDLLSNERTRTLDNEREIERLRGLDLQLDALQQNFANFTACKEAQREAAVEEERALQTCVELVGSDVFSLPASLQTEEQVELWLHQLQELEAKNAAEERTRATLKSTVVGYRDERSGRKQLAALMQRRFNAIQIFACEQRLRQMHLERSLQQTLAEADEHDVQNQGAMEELAHAREQCKTLLERHTALDQQRRELEKARTASEQEVKQLRQVMLKMRVAHEEQESVLLELGTRLQNVQVTSGGPINRLIPDGM